MSQLSRTYRLKRFTSSDDPDFAKILRLYIANIGPGLRTNSNEITYWLDRTYKEFGDEFILCGLYLNKTIIGFAELAYFGRQKIVAFDYLVLHKDYRTQSEYYQFARLLQDWINESGLEFDYVVADVSYESTSSLPSKECAVLVRLFKQIGFLVVDCEYWSPSLGVDNPQSDMRAFLLVLSREPRATIRRETVLSIASTIYFNHNQRWYDATIGDEAERKSYQLSLQTRYQELCDRLAGRQDIVLDGEELLAPPFGPSRAPRRTAHANVLPSLVIVWALGIFCALFAALQYFLPISAGMVLLLFGASLVTFLCAWALFDAKAVRVLRPLLSFFTKIFDKPQ